MPDIGDLCENRYRFDGKGGCQFSANRQTEKSQIVIYKAALQLYVPDTAVLRCPLYPWQEGDFLSGDLLLQGESVFDRWQGNVHRGCAERVQLSPRQMLPGVSSRS